MMSRFLQFLSMAFCAGLFSSCGIFNSQEEEETPVEVVKKEEQEHSAEDHLPDNLVMPVHFPYDPVMPQYIERQGLREPDVTSSLPLNIDGSAFTENPPAADVNNIAGHDDKDAGITETEAGESNKEENTENSADPSAPK